MNFNKTQDTLNDLLLGDHIRVILKTRNLNYIISSYCA